MALPYHGRNQAAAFPVPIRSPVVREVQELARLGGPLVVTQVSQVGMAVTDTIMAGRLSPLDLAAVALGSSLFTPVYLACVGILLALSPSVAHLTGARREQDIGPLFRQGLWLALLLAVLATPAVVWTAALMPLFGVAADMQPLTGDYLAAFAWGMPAVCVYLAARYVSEGRGFTRPVMYIQLLALVLNGLGNWVLMFGKLGFPALGAEGAGWSSAIVLWVDAALMLTILHRHPRFRHLALLRRPERPEIAALWRLLRLGVPIGATIVMEVGLFSAVALFMGRFGTVAVAAHQVAINYAAMMFMIPLGLSLAITVRVGHAAGAGDRAGERLAGLVGMGMGLAVMSVSALVMVLAPRFIIGLYTADAAVLGLAVGLLQMAALFQLSDGLQVSAMGALRGLKDTTWPMIANLLAYWGVGLPLGWYLGFGAGLGPRGLWLGLVGGLTVAAVLLAARFLWQTRRGAIQ